MRYTAWMATALLALAAGMGCQTTPTNPKADEAPALTTLGQQTFTAVLSGDPVFLEPLTLWGVPEAELTRAISEVYLTDARTHLRQLKAVPTAQRTATHLETIKFYQTFIRDPEPQLARLTPAIHVEAARIQTNHVALLQTLPASRTPKTAPNIIVRGVDTQSALPEAAVEVLFAVGDRNYSLQLNTCVKLPGIGWRVAEDLTLVDLSARAEAAKTWMEDFPAAQVKARDEKKKLLVYFTGSDWCPPCKALHQRVLTTRAFLDHVKDRYILVKVDFPRNLPQPDNLRAANRILAREFKVESFPTMLVLDAEGQEQNRLNGYENVPVGDFIKALETPPPAPPKPAPKPESQPDGTPKPESTPTP